MPSRFHITYFVFFFPLCFSSSATPADSKVLAPNLSSPNLSTPNRPTPNLSSENPRTPNTRTLNHASLKGNIPRSNLSTSVVLRNTPPLIAQLRKKHLMLGSALFIRIFKQSSELEVWIKPAISAEFKHFKTYPICKFSGSPGPKQQQGDKQSPEGFYFVTPKRLNPWSQYHLSFNLGYPNAYDRANGRTGDALMIHGRCVSVGCYVMTDAGIEEIYTIANAAFENGQPFFRVHAFPFRLESQILDNHKSNRRYSFWVNLKEGYDWFEQYRVPPNVTTRNNIYEFD